MTKLSHDKFADKGVLDPLKEEFRGLITLTEDSTYAIQKLKKVFSETKEIKSSKDVKKLSDATAELNRQEKVLTQARKDQDTAQKRALKGLTDNEKAAKKLTAAQKENIAVRQKGVKSIAEQRVKTQELNKQTKVLARQTLGLIKPHERLTRATDKAQKEFKDLAVQYGVTSKQAQRAEKRFRKLDDQLRRVNNRAKDGRRDVGRYGLALKGLRSSLGRGLGFLGIAAGGAAVVSVFSNVIGIFSKLAKANSNLQAVTGATENQMIALKDAQEDLGATTANTAQEYAELQTELAKLGFPTAEILEMTAAIQAGGQAMSADLGANAQLTGSIIKIFGDAAGGAAEINDVLAASTSKSALDFEKLSSSMSTIGPVAKAFGFSLKGTVSLLGGLADAGFDASSAATATRNIMLNLADSSSELGKRLKEPVKDLPSLVKGLNQLKEEGVDLGEALELTDKRSVAAFNTFLNGTDSVLALNSALNDSVGTAQRMAETQLDNLIGDVTLLNSAWEGFVLSVESGDGTFNKALRSIVKGTTRLIGGFTKQTTAVDKNIRSLEKQRDTLFDLSLQLSDNNINAQERNKLLNELEELYPELLENLDKEKLSYDELQVILKKANGQLNVRLQIQQALVDVDAAQNNLLRGRAAVQQNKTEIIKEAVKVLREQNREEELFGLSLQETIDLVKEETGVFSTFQSLLTQRKNLISLVASEEKSLNREREISNATITALLSGTTSLNDLSTAELRTLVLNGQLISQKLIDQATYIIILRERIRTQKDANDLDDESNRINGKIKEVETDLIRLKQKQIAERKKESAADLEALRIKNQELADLGRQLKILQEHGIEKDKEAKRQKEEIDRLRILQELRQAELRGLIELNERLLEGENLSLEQRVEVTEELFRLRKEAIEEAAEFELSNDMLTADERLVIAANLNNDLAALEFDRVNAVKEANDAILALEKEANEKRRAQNRAFFDSIKNSALKSIDEQNKAVNDRLNNDVKSREDAVRLQQERAGKGLENSLAQQEALLDKARLKRDQELEDQRKREEKLALFIGFLNQFQALSNQDPDTAAFKAFQNTFLAKAIGDTFLAREDGGVVSGPEQLVRMNEAGPEFVIRHKEAKALGLDKPGADMDDFNRIISSRGDTNLVKSVEDYYSGNQWGFMQSVAPESNMDSEKIVRAINASSKGTEAAIKKYKASFNFDANGLGEMMVTIGEGATTKAVNFIIDNYNLTPRR